MKKQILPLLQGLPTFALRTWVLGLAFASISFVALGQSTPPAKETKVDKPQVILDGHGWTTEGNLVLGFRISATPEKDLTLGNANHPFSLREGSLVDLNTKATLQPLPLNPRNPYFGPSDIATTLVSGGWITLGLAFKKPEEPAKDAQGKPQSYKFRFTPPMKMEPVEFEIPYPTSPAKQSPTP